MALAKPDPWLEFADPVDVADQPTAQPPATPASDAPPGPPPADTPAAGGDQFAAIAEPATVVPTQEYEGGFSDELPDQVANVLPPEDEAHIVELIRNKQDDEAIRFAASRGFQIPNISEIAAHREKTGQVGDAFAYNKPTPLDDDGAGGAFARGVADVPTFGFADELHGLAQGVEKAVTGKQSEQGFWHDVHVADDVYSGRVDHDEAEHPLARISGQLLGGLAIPVSYEGVGLRAGAAAMREARAAGAVTTQEALRIGRRAAARAVTTAMTRDGVLIGGAHGVGTGEGAEGRVGEGLLEAGLGGVGGAAFGAAGEAAAPRIAASRATARAAPLTDAQQVGQAAERQGIDLLPADVGGPATRRATGVMTQTIAGGTPIINAAKRVIEQGKALRDRTASRVGEATNAEAAGETAYEGALKYKSASRSKIGRIYDIAATQAGDVRVELPDAKAVLNEQIARLKEVPGGGQGLAEAQELRASLEGKFTVQGVRDMRTEMFVSPDFRGTPVERRLKQVIDAAANDIATGLTKAGKPEAAKTFRLADEQWKERLKTMKRVIEPIIGRNEDQAKSGEQIVQGLERAAKGQGRRFERFLSALPEEDAAIVRASLISRMGRTSAGRQGAEGQDFSLNDFLTHWNSMGERAKNAAFGREGRAALNDLARIAEGTKEAQGYHNFSNTFGGVGNFITAATGLAGWPAFLKVVAGQYAIGRLLASPRFARWLARAPRARDQGAYVERLGRIAKAEPAIASDVLSLQQRLVDAFSGQPMRAAAEPKSDSGDSSEDQ